MKGSNPSWIEADTDSKLKLAKFMLNMKFSSYY